MQVKETVFPLSKVLTLPNGGGGNKHYIDIIINEEIPIVCINKSAQKKRLMPFKVLNDNKDGFWRIQGGSWEYFLTGESIEILKEKTAVKRAAWEDAKKNAQTPGTVTAQKEAPSEPIKLDGLGKEYNYYADMTPQKRIECIDREKHRLDDLLSKKHKDEVEVTEALVDSTKEAAMINHAAIEEALNFADDEAKRFTQDMVNSTTEMIKSSAQLLSEDVFSNELMSALVEKSNGTIVQHMTRVYLNGIAFLTYYNNLVSTSSAIQKLRISFPTKFRKLYQSLLPHVHVDDLNLERVFFGGMRAITPELYFKWAVGFLVHDIGKANAIEYHEGEAAFDRKLVVDHVKLGYKQIMTKTNYPIEASLITGYHHEYYGDSAGYGYFRFYLQQYKKANPSAKQDYCITYELEPILDYQALAYFPAKVLEIIDVYDSLTDPHRVYRKPMEPEEALVMMREEFIEKHLKLDPILFSMFETFTREKLEKKK